MTDEEGYSREELLYLARLAEQCDRFDGKLSDNPPLQRLKH